MFKNYLNISKLSNHEWLVMRHNLFQNAKVDLTWPNYITIIMAKSRPRIQLESSDAVSVQYDCCPICTLTYVPRTSRPTKPSGCPRVKPGQLSHGSWLLDNALLYLSIFYYAFSLLFKYPSPHKSAQPPGCNENQKSRGEPAIKSTIYTNTFERTGRMMPNEDSIVESYKRNLPGC